MGLLLLLVVSSIALLVSNAELIIYPGPPNMQPSDKYQVSVGLADPLLSSFTYISTSNHRITENTSYVRANRSVSWTSFAFTGDPVVIEVKTLQDFKTCIVRPRSYGISCTRTWNNTARFTVTRNSSMMSVEFDNNDMEQVSEIVDKLMIFADPPETDVPIKEDPSVLYFDVGVHYLGGQVPLNSSIKQVYISPGAFVDGGFITEENTTIKIHGRGICSGRKFGFHDKRFLWATLETSKGSKHVVEGITLSDPPQFFYYGQGPNMTVRNVKMLGAWPYNSDGIEMGVGGLVEDVFIMSNDDSLKVYTDDFTVRRVVVWQMQNGAVFQTGWWKNRQLHRVSVSDVDVIHTDWCTFRGPVCKSLSKNDAVFDLGGDVEIMDINKVMFNNVRLEGFCPRLVNWKMSPGTNGTARNIKFDNFSMDVQTSQGKLDNEIAGYKPNGFAKDWTFVNLTVGGRCISTPDEGRFNIDPSTTSNIRFLCSP